MGEIESINDAIFYTYFGFNNYDKTWIFKCVQSWRTLLKLLKSFVFLYIKSPTGKLSKMQRCVCVLNHVNQSTCFVTCMHPLSAWVFIYFIEQYSHTVSLFQGRSARATRSSGSLHSLLRTMRNLLMKKESESEVAQSCPSLFNPKDCSLRGSSAHGIF